MTGRLLRTGATLALVFVVCFLLLHALPGDPTDRLDAPGVPAEQAERTRRALGLDRPLPEQFVRTLVSWARGDLGVSTTRGRPVADVLAEALPYTAALGVGVLLLAYGTGLPLALALVVLPERRRRRVDRVLLLLGIVPRFWLAVLLVLLLHSLAGWLPASHAFSPGGGGVLDRLRHLVLPALSLGLPAACVVARYLLSVMERVREAPHVRAARAAGSAGTRLLVRSVLLPSAGTAVALFALDLPVLVSGGIVIETIFAWPGVGRLTAQAVLAGAVVLLGRHGAEAATRRLDPRQGGAHWEALP